MPPTALAGRGKDLPRPPLAGRIQSVVQRRFGLKRLRPGQQEVITRVFKGQPTLAIMPTGLTMSCRYAATAAAPWSEQMRCPCWLNFPGAGSAAF